MSRFEYYKQDDSGKFSINNGQPYLYPHKCVACNTQKSTDYIDFGVKINRYGRVYFCVDCFEECYNALFQTTRTFEEMMETIESYMGKNTQLREENAHLRSIVNDLNQLLSGIPSLQSDVQEHSDPPKRRPGRPKGTKQGTTKSATS